MLLKIELSYGSTIRSLKQSMLPVGRSLQPYKRPSTLWPSTRCCCCRCCCQLLGLGGTPSTSSADSMPALAMSSTICVQVCDDREPRFGCREEEDRIWHGGLQNLPHPTTQ